MVLCAIVSLVGLCLFLHPYIIYPATLRLFPPRPVEPRLAADPLSFSLLFSAYNEERALPEKIANLRAIKAAHPDVEILAYVDLSSDRTADLLRAEGDLLTVVAATERTGKATGMGRLVAQAAGDVCIFTDANVVLDPGAIDVLRRCFAAPEIGGVAGALHYTNEDASTTAKVGGLYWRLEERIKERESACGSMMGADGSIFATRRSLYPFVPAHLLDDMTVSMTVALRGHRLIHSTAVQAFERSATSSADEFRRKRRIACRAYNTHRHLWPAIRATFGVADRYKYISHKLLRWFGVVCLAKFVLFGAAALALAGLWWLAAAGVAAMVIGIALGGAGLRPFATVYEILKSVLATFYGVIDAWRGMTYQTWAPAKSRD
jgi:cellulose synthase/poly-beta-1,6-N-acetylglucosamine synthase-like glycosyltransferase